MEKTLQDCALKLQIMPIFPGPPLTTAELMEEMEGKGSNKGEVRPRPLTHPLGRVE